MKYKEIEIMKASIQMPQGVYEFLRRKALEEGSTISELVGKYIANEVDSINEILTEEFQVELRERLENCLLSLNDGYIFLGIYNRISFEKNIKSIAETVDWIYGDQGGVFRRRLINLLSFKDNSYFSNMISELEKNNIEIEKKINNSYEMVDKMLSEKINNTLKLYRENKTIEGDIK